MAHPDHTITSIGRIAKSWLAQTTSASVCGVTSRGIFLSLPGEQVVFLSSESHRGPLTLNLIGGRQVFPAVPLHTIIQVEPDRLVFLANGCRLSMQSAAVWEAPPAAQLLPGEDYLERLVALADAAHAGREAGLLAAALAGLPGFDQPPSNHTVNWPLRLSGVRQTLAGGDVQSIAAALEAFLGLGSGLTPSGDDFVLGLLLALNRWGRRLVPGVDVSTLNRSVLPAARLKTTALSACLIQCAAQGQADERLIIALDGILTGKPDIGMCAAGLRSWGSSSGTDALAGMAVVLLCKTCFGSPSMR